MLTAKYLSPLGRIILAADSGAIIGLWFEGQKYECAGLAGSGNECPGDRELLRRCEQWLDGYFAGSPAEPDLPLAPVGTDFQKSVWEQLRHIPRGETSSYGRLALEIGCASARAVGAAVGRNPISILIPCHRVLGAGGELTGYAGGLYRKRELLRLEGICPE